MSSLTPSPRRFDAAVVLLALAVGALAVASAWNDSATADEPAHIVSGLLKLQHGAIDFYATQPPLMDALVALPVSLAGYRAPANWESVGNRPWVLGRDFVFRSGHDSQRILRLARITPIVLLVALCFAVYAFVLRVTQNLFAALASFALTGFCPVLLAHGRLATMDLGAAFFTFAAAAAFLSLKRTPSMPLAILCGVATACAIAAKTSGAILIPFFLVLAVRVPIRQLLAAAVAAIAAFLAIYFALGSTDPFRTWLQGAENIRQLYTLGFTRPQFLLGEFSPTGWKHYYVVAAAVKSTLPAIVLAIGAAAIGIRRRNFTILACIAFAMLFVIAASFSSLNIGIRHVLPIYPFVYAAIGIAIATLDDKRFRTAAGAVIALHVLTALLAFPSYLSYFNAFIGDPRNADRVLIDSNLDWGQDLRRLGDWTRDNNIERIRVHYFGAADVTQELGPRAERWPAPRAQPLPPGWFAVSRHYYRLSFHPRSRMNYDDYLRRSNARYFTTIGGSIDVYRVE